MVLIGLSCFIDIKFVTIKGCLAAYKFLNFHVYYIQPYYILEFFKFIYEKHKFESKQYRN